MLRKRSQGVREIMKLTLKEIAEIVGGSLDGDENYVITGVSSLENAKPTDITFCTGSKFYEMLKNTHAGAVIINVNENINIERSVNFIRVGYNPYVAFSKILEIYEKEIYENNTIRGIHPTAIIGRNVELGEDVAIGAYTVVGDNTKIGKNTKIFHNCVVENNVKIGENCRIYHNVVIRERCVVGNNVTIHAGTVVGSDGFGFIPTGEAPIKVPQVGYVEICDDVEIGANCTIDRATVGVTKICKGTKLDNLVQVGHNVEIGENCIIASQVGIAGSTKIGRNVIIGGQAGIADHLVIGDNVKIGAQAGVISNIESGMAVSGYPAKSHIEAMREQVIINKLPEIYRTIKKRGEKK